MSNKRDFITDIKVLREKHNLSQQQFANQLGISVATLRNWEQGRRKPEGPARILIHVIDLFPEILALEGTKNDEPK